MASTLQLANSKAAPQPISGGEGDRHPADQIIL